MFCSQCGNQVASGTTFCPVCGARMDASLTGSKVGQPIAAQTFQSSSSVAPYGVDPRSGLPYSSRSKLAAGLLQIFLGGLGIGRFYTGHVGMAVAQIVVTFVTCGLGAIWPLVDGIMLLVADDAKDADGKPLRN